LKKLRAEEEEAAKSRGTFVKGKVDLEKEWEAGKENWALEQVRKGGINSASTLPRLSHKIVQSQKIAMAIGEWQQCLEMLERESLGLDDYIQLLFVEKEEARMTLHKVTSPMEYGSKLIADAQAKLSELEAERDTMKAKMDSVRPEEGGLDLIDIDPAMVDFEGLQHRGDAQKGILAVFEETCGGGQAEKLELVKLTNAKETWSNAKSRQTLWKRHRLAF
jgi:hypothetical protein